MYAKLVYSSPFFFAAIAIFIVAVYTMSRRNNPGAWYLILLSLSGAIWSASEGMLYLGLDMQTNTLITYIQYLGVSPLIPLTLLFTMSVFGYEKWVNRSTIMLLMTIAVAIILLVWTNSIHHMVFRAFYLIDSGPVPMLGLRHGPLWWTIIGYHYYLAACMSTILLRAVVVTSGPGRSQACSVLFAVGVLWAANAVYVAGMSPVANMDLGPLAFILVALSLAWAFFRYNLMNVLPVAKAQVFKALNDPIVVLDAKNRIIDLNPAAARLFNRKASEFIGHEIDFLIGDYPELADLDYILPIKEIPLSVQNQERYYELRESLLKDKAGAAAGRVIIFHDITERRHTDKALHDSERLQGALEMAGTVCHDLTQPLLVLAECSNLIQANVNADDPVYPKTLKLAEQAQRLQETARRLMHLTRYETRNYMGGKILDLEKSSLESEG
jgi:PAS domain S-box-containing protein